MRAQFTSVLTWLCAPVTEPPPRLLVVIVGLLFVLGPAIDRLPGSVFTYVSVAFVLALSVRLTYLWNKSRKDESDG